MFAHAIRSVHSLPIWWRSRPASAKDGALAAVLTLLAFVPTLSAIAGQIGDLPRRPPDALALALILAQSASLAIRSRWPAACLALTGGAFAIHQVLSYPPTFASLGFYLALYAAGAHQARFRRGLAGVASACYVVLAVVLHGLGSPDRVQDFIAFYLALAVMWLVGTGMRRWRAEEAEHRRLSANAATAAERARIARELHDVVTHHVTAMVIQADAAQFLVSSAPERAGDGLAAISDTGRRALTELRHLLGVLEATGDSAAADRMPTLGRIADLVEQARLSGQPVGFTEHGEPRAQSVNVELAAYRVVQEALTNAMKYATGQSTTVAIHYHDAHIDIDVTTATATATSGTPAAVPSGGRGLAGLRERVRLLDGELTAEPCPDGGFSVRARIPSRSDP